MSIAARPEATWFPEDRTFVSAETYDAFFAVIERLEATIDAETTALAANSTGRIVDLTRQKRQGFLELNRIMKAMERTIPSQDILARLAAFRGRLEENDTVLRIHLRAVQEVTALIVKVMRDSESDGTYSRGFGHATYDDA